VGRSVDELITRMPSCRRQTRAMRNHAKNCCSSTLKQVTDNLTTCLK